jgi:hypothetical protein
MYWRPKTRLLFTSWSKKYESWIAW